MGDKVTFYVEANYRGNGFTGPRGQYDFNENQKTFRSVKVPAGSVILLYSERGCTGTYFATLSSENLGDRVGTWKSVLIAELAAVLKPYALVYTEENLNGMKQLLTASRYNVDELDFGDNRIRSLKVVEGYQVTFFEDPNFTGRAVSYLADATSLGDFASQASSLVVEKIPSDAQVILYENDGYSGRAHPVGIGRYDRNELLVGDNALSSLKVPKGYSVTLFEHAGFRGDRLVVTKNASTLGSFSDRVSSVKVEKLPTVGTLSGVRVFAASRYRGASQTLSQGGYNVVDIGFPDNAIGSLKVPSGYYVLLYEDANCQGEAAFYSANTEFVGELTGRVSSIFIVKAGGDPRPVLKAGDGSLPLDPGVYPLGQILELMGGGTPPDYYSFDLTPCFKVTVENYGYSFNYTKEMGTLRSEDAFLVEIAIDIF